MNTTEPLAHNGLGHNSLIFGSLGLIVVTASKYAQSVRNPRSAVFLEFLDRLGWVNNQSLALVTEVKPSPLLPFTDGAILSMLVWFGIYLSALAILYSILAEYRNEDSLLLSAGLICGILGFYVFHTATAIAIILVCAGIVLWSRAKPQL